MLIYTLGGSDRECKGARLLAERVAELESELESEPDYRSGFHLSPDDTGELAKVVVTARAALAFADQNPLNQGVAFRVAMGCLVDFFDDLIVEGTDVRPN